MDPGGMDGRKYGSGRHIKNSKNRVIRKVGEFIGPRVSFCRLNNILKKVDPDLNHIKSNHSALSRTIMHNKDHVDPTFTLYLIESISICVYMQRNKEDFHSEI